VSLWKATIHIYILKKVSKKLKIDCIHSTLSKNAKSRFGSLGLLGVKMLPYYWLGATIHDLVLDFHVSWFEIAYAVNFMTT
jgi:hypothetical protein